MARLGIEMGSGALSNAIATIIGPVPVGATWYVTKLDLVNIAGTEESVTLYVDQNGTARQWKRFTLDPTGGQAEIIADDRALILNAGGLVRGVSSNPGAVEYTASGVSET